MRLLGELYNYRMLDSTAIFKILFTLIPREAGIW